MFLSVIKDVVYSIMADSVFVNSIIARIMWGHCLLRLPPAVGVCAHLAVSSGRDAIIAVNTVRFAQMWTALI
jgi:hypothetical protein